MKRKSLKERVKGLDILRQHDQKLQELERAIAEVQASRREVVNLYGLNKPLSA